MTPKHTNHIKVPVTLSLTHPPTLRLEIIKLSQTVGVISGYLVYKLGIIRETCCQTELQISSSGQNMTAPKSYAWIYGDKWSRG